MNNIKSAQDIKDWVEVCISRDHYPTEAEVEELCDRLFLACYDNSYNSIDTKVLEEGLEAIRLVDPDICDCDVLGFSFKI